MTLTLEVPDDLAARLEASRRDLSKETLEALAVEANVRGDLSSEEVQRLLHFFCAQETDALLRWTDRTETSTEESAAATGVSRKRKLSPIQRGALARTKRGLDFGGAPYPKWEDLYDREVLRC